jgi:hypothetical protein
MKGRRRSFSYHGDIYKEISHVPDEERILLLVQIVLTLRRLELQNIDHTDFYNEERTLVLTFNPIATFLIRNPFRTKTNACERKRRQTKAEPPSQFALCSALVCILYKFCCTFKEL